MKIIYNNPSISGTPEKLLEMLSHIWYKDFSRLMSPLEVFISCCGSCHDQSMLEFQELSDMRLDPKAKFILAVDENGNGLETHSFVYFNRDNKFCWIENAWEEMRGLHWFSSYDDMIRYIMTKFIERVNSAKSYFLADFNPDEHTIGENLDELVDICMNSAHEFEPSGTT